jgi:lantibiotic biosynthesis protein
MKSSTYQFHEKVIARLPAKPFDSAMPDNIVDLLINDSHFLEAIYVASPVLYREAIKYKEGQVVDQKGIKKIKTSLVKYYQRMCSRCTPFGLFSGCTTLPWNNKVNNEKENTLTTKRHTRLDMHYLCALAQKIAKEKVIEERILFYPNSSYYVIGDEIRYIEYQYKDGKRKHQISAVEYSEELLSLLLEAKSGKTIASLKQILQQHNIENDFMDSFMQELIDSQLLVNELEPAITGEEFTFQIIAVLQKINTDNNEIIINYITTLQQVNDHIKIIDAKKGNTIDAYNNITTLLLKNDIVFEENKLFQTDLFFSIPNTNVSSSYQETIMDVLQLFTKMYSHTQNNNLINFINRFTERYDAQEIPLLQVLDAESGIGYIQGQHKSITPLIDDIQIFNKQTENSIRINETEGWLLKKLIEANASNSYSIEIKEEEMENFKETEDMLPASLSCMFRIINDQQIIIEGFSGSSAANLLGRFTHGNAEIHSIVDTITTKEAKVNDSIIFAEIIHLPESRIGNILLRENSRDYEIPFLAKSSLPHQNQITLDDLYISIQNGKIILRSKRLNKIIVPRLSSAHNYSYNALPVYQFLCDIQNQDIQLGLSFYWGSIASYFNFLPRVTFKNAILQEATWHIHKVEIESFIKNINVFYKFIESKKIPSFFVLVDGDNELLVNTKSSTSVDAFIETIKKRNSIVIKEIIIPTTKLFTNENKEFYCNQFIAPLIKTEKIYKDILQKDIKNIEIQREFLIGSKWLYYKLYCGCNDAEKILTTNILPLIQYLLKEKLITEFYFIRYTDPQFHLRIRFLIPDVNNTPQILKICSITFKDLLDKQFVWKIQNDLYIREIERYHPLLIESTESLFFMDSITTLHFLNKLNSEEKEKERWLFAMQKIETLLKLFNYSLDDKIELCLKLKTAFKKEFQFDKNANNTINKKYNENRAIILNKIYDEKNIIDFEFNKAIEILIVSIKTHSLKIDDYLPSYIHMILNRIFITNVRLHEAVVYDFMHKWYVGEQHKLKILNNNESIVNI